MRDVIDGIAASSPFDLAIEAGVGTRLQLGCQDITGPNPSVLLDKAGRR